MPDYSRYGAAWHSNSWFSRRIGALKKGTRRARASIEPQPEGGSIAASPLARQAVPPKLLLGWIAIARGPRICCEALRKGIEERTDGGNHAAPRWKHGMH